MKKISNDSIAPEDQLILVGKIIEEIREEKPDIHDTPLSILDLIIKFENQGFHASKEDITEALWSFAQTEEGKAQLSLGNMAGGSIVLCFRPVQELQEIKKDFERIVSGESTKEIQGKIKEIKKKDK